MINMEKFIKNEQGLSYEDISIVPAISSSVQSRKECNPFDENDMLPLFTAPMTSVVGPRSRDTYIKNKIYPILPRPVEGRIEGIQANPNAWIAVGLEEFAKHFVNNPLPPGKYHVLIDVANGHMQKIYDLVEQAKGLNNQLVVMVGNIANPETMKLAREASVDYVRVGIGGGRGCITSSNTGIHYPMASLISDCFEFREKICSKTKIVADGGIRNYSDVIKALALGADYVMIGSVFTKMLESEAPILTDAGKYLDLEDIEYRSGNFYRIPCNTEQGSTKINLMKSFYGMASKKGMSDLGIGSSGRTAEGLITTLPVEYTMKSWTENLVDYLRSAMSYAGSRTLDEFRDKTRLIINSPGTVTAINK